MTTKDERYKARIAAFTAMRERAKQWDTLADRLWAHRLDHEQPKSYRRFRDHAARCRRDAVLLT